MIKEVSANELDEALRLVNETFCEFVAKDYSQQGRETFENYLKTKSGEISSDLLSGHKKMWAYFDSGEIIGVIATRNTSHISLLFVDKKHHRKGIAKKLFSFLLTQMSRDVKQITVNSSPYAEEIYERLGFRATDVRQEKDGMIFIPMAFDL